MPWKRDGSNNIVIGESGNPIFVYPDGNEIDFDADSQVVKIRELTEKASKRKETLDNMVAALNPLSEAGVDVSSAEAIGEFTKKAKANADVVRNFKEEDYVKADAVQRIKDEEAKRYRDQIQHQENTYKRKLEQKDGELDKLKSSVRKSVVKNAFMTSDFIRKRTSYPTPEIAYQHLEDKFVVEDVNGEAVPFGIDREGNKLYSLKSPTDFASAHEAIEIIINNHPQRDNLLLADGGGSDAQTNKGRSTVANQKIIPKGDRMAFGMNLEKIAKGEVKVEPRG